MADAIVTKALSKRVGDRKILADVNLRLRDGEFLSLLGPSGCGKTTLLKALAGIDRDVDGEVHIFGETLSSARQQDQTRPVLIWQSLALFEHMNARKNIAFGLRAKNFTKAEIETRVQKSLRQVGLDGFSERYPTKMSGGERQRLAIARAIALDPKILLLDEPLGNIDPALRREIRQLLRSLHKGGTSMVMVSHDHQDAIALSDRVAIMNAGRLIQVGSVDELTFRPQSVFVAHFFGHQNTFEGLITDASEEVATVSLGSYRLPASQASWVDDSPTVGEPGTLIVAPDRIRPVPTSQQLFEANVDHCHTYDGVFEAHLSHNVLGQFRVRGENWKEFKEGTSVGVNWTVSDAFVLTQ